MNPHPILTIFWGEASEARAMLYARVTLPAVIDPALCSVTGSLHGPFVCESQTIPAHYGFQTIPGGKTLLAQSIVVDPCFWTTRAPSLYRVQIKVHLPSGESFDYERLTGIRRLGAAGQDLRWEGRRWVLRGVGIQHETPDLHWCRETGTTLVASNPSPRLCSEASNRGVLIVACIDADSASDAVLDGLAQWPAVGVLWLKGGDETVVQRARYFIPNVLLAQAIPCANFASVQDWANVIILDAVDLLAPDSLLSGDRKPVLVCQRSEPSCDLREARQRCDTLQRRLGVAGRLSGYVVT